MAAALVIAIGWRVATSAGPVVSPPAPGDLTATPSDRTVARFALARIDLRRSAGQLPRLVVPRGTTGVRLEPDLEAPVPDADYAVSLRRVEGQITWQGHTDAVHGRIGVTVPAQLVGPGDYVLRLAAPGAALEASAEYPFRVAAGD